MIQAVVIFPEFEGLSDIQKIRKQYDPQSGLIMPHITLVFPFKKDFSDKSLDEHINESLRDIELFQIRLKGITKSPVEYYLYLLIIKGNETIIKIHKRLYSGLPEKRLRKDIPYLPHITLGAFESEKEIDDAAKKVKEESLDFSCTIDSVYLLNIEDNMQAMESLKRYRLDGI